MNQNDTVMLQHGKAFIHHGITMGEEKILTPLQREIVDEFGNIYESYGLKRLKGLLVGLLLTQPEPVSLDEMARLLGRSKGPISSAIRELASIGLVRKVNGPENRRDYYVAHPDIFYNNFRFNMLTVHKNKVLAEKVLQRLEEQPEEDREAVHRHFAHMQAFYSLMEDFYRGFSERWEQRRKELGLED